MHNNCKLQNETVMIGDTVFDIEGGKENGLATIAVTYGFGKEDTLRETRSPILWPIVSKNCMRLLSFNRHFDLFDPLR